LPEAIEWNVGTWDSDANGEVTSGRTMRARVRKRSLGVQLYGAYVRPYGSFRWLEQADLRNAYLQSGVRSLNFRIGYGYGRVPSNLLLARKEN
jgi:hypothetical protein